MFSEPQFPALGDGNSSLQCPGLPGECSAVAAGVSPVVPGAEELLAVRSSFPPAGRRHCSRCCSERGPPGAGFPVVRQGLWHLVFHGHPMRWREQPGLFGSILQLWTSRCSEVLRLLPKGTPSVGHTRKASAQARKMALVPETRPQNRVLSREGLCCGAASSPLSTGELDSDLVCFPSVKPVSCQRSCRVGPGPSPATLKSRAVTTETKR